MSLRLGVVPGTLVLGLQLAEPPYSPPESLTQIYVCPAWAACPARRKADRTIAHGAPAGQAAVEGLRVWSVFCSEEFILALRLMLWFAMVSWVEPTHKIYSTSKITHVANNCNNKDRKSVV